MMISIVISARNDDRRIGGLLDSLLGHQLVGFDHEVIVVDDGSVDGTVHEVESRARNYSNNLKLIRHPRPRGPSFARTAGADAADPSCELLVFCEPHIYISPDNWVSELQDLIGHGISRKDFVLTFESSQEYDETQPDRGAGHVLRRGGMHVCKLFGGGSMLCGVLDLEKDTTIGDIQYNHQYSIAPVPIVGGGLCCMPYHTYFDALGGLFDLGIHRTGDDGELSFRAWSFGVPCFNSSTRVAFVHESNWQKRSSNYQAQQQMQQHERFGDTHNFCKDILRLGRLYFDKSKKFEKLCIPWFQKNYPEHFAKAWQEQDSDPEFWRYYNWIQENRINDSEWMVREMTLW